MAKNTQEPQAGEHLRIRRYDSLNWLIDRWVPGTMQAKGFGAGKVSQSKWVEVGFYSKLEHAAKAILDDCLADDCPTEGWAEISTVLEAIKLAEARAARIVSKYALEDALSKVSAEAREKA